MKQTRPQKPRNANGNSPRKILGFTLIELMIVVAVIGILAAIAMPSYQRYVEKSRRADAQAGLMQAAQNLERCFTRTNTYQGCNVPGSSPDGFYNITSTLGATSFTLTATATGPQTGDKCSPFTLDHRGEKTADSTTENCWGS